ncbi:MAG: hypothetical protein OXB88_07150 [Bacteriovoracales bacterium]|nr:hypothetical protein [Bacteriovoracales bacterium]
MQIPLANGPTTKELVLTDVEHLTPESVDRYYESITQDLLGMGEEDHLRIYYKKGRVYLNSNNPELSLSPETAPARSLLKELLGEEITSSNVINRGDHLKLGGKYLRFLRLTEFPREIVSHGHFNQVGDYFMSIRRIPSHKASSLLDRKRKVFRSDNSGEFSNYKSEEGESQAESLYSEIQLGTEGLFEVEFWFWVLSDTQAELASQTNALLTFFKHSKGCVKIEDIGLSEAFLNFIPGMPPTFKGPTVVPSCYLLGLMPLSGDSVHESGLLFHSVSDGEVFFDNFAGANFNTAIVGHSGSGKSFLAQKIVDHHLENDVKAVIIDRGETFSRLAEYHGGTVFEGRLNPLQFKNAGFLTEFLMGFIPEGEFSHRQKCLLFKILKDNISQIDDTASLFSLLDKKIEHFSLYFEAHKKLFTDKKRTISRITYVDTGKYPDEFLRPLFIYLTEYVKSLKGRKIFVFEECWFGLQHDIAHLGEFFRTSRALGIGCMAVTQCFDDLLKSDLGKIIAENTYFKIFFSAPKKQNEYLGEHDLERIESLSSVKGQYSEFYLKSPSHRKTLRFYPTPLEHERFTSSFEDRKKIDRFISRFQEHFDYKTLIQRWTELKYGQISSDPHIHSSR